MYPVNALPLNSLRRAAVWLPLCSSLWLTSGCEEALPAGPALGGELGGGDVQGESQAPLSCSQVRAPLRRVVRLTAREFQNTLRDTFGVETDYASVFPADPTLHGFARYADLLLVTPLLADKLQTAAEEIAHTADLTPFAPCMLEPDQDCLEALASGLGRRLFRRPVVDAELLPYLELAKEASSPREGAERMLAAMLQSPHFLYRTELGVRAAEGGLYQLDDHEVASALSYLIWQTEPDVQLREAAEKGALRSETQVQAEVTRMLRDPRARPVLRTFVTEWFGLSTMLTVPKDLNTFPDLTLEIRQGLLREVERFVDHALFTLDGSIATLLTSDVTFLDPTSAAFYGLPNASSVDEHDAYTLAEQGRRGILTLGGTMLVHARSNDASPVHRGRLIREHVLCEGLAPPPPGLVIEPPPLDPTKSSRERYAAHSQEEPCASCHKRMDPIGFAFDHFDGIGRYRADDHGHPIDDHAEILLSSDVQGSYADRDAMIDALAGSAQVKRCYARSMFRFAYGLSEDTRGNCLLARQEEAFAASDGSFLSLISVLISADLLLKREASAEAPAEEYDAEDAGSSVPDVKPPPTSEEAASELQAEVTVNNDWGAGYCRTYQLTNAGAAPLTWMLTLELEGTLNQHWESRSSGEAGSVTFSGVEHNAVLAAGASTQFGFCVTR